ncbi:MAG: alpha/beta fold hydrolase [Candidatus Promineifilaceae bacterium]|nr:alpha/beta fold hydrolase [Candidatus Promineifilaceae bacterium]
MKRHWWILLAVLLMVAALILGFVIWAVSGPEATAEAQLALNSNSEVNVQDNEWLVFQPQAAAATTGLIFYPGGRVDPAAYAPLAREIAAAGYRVVITPMPLNFAFLAPERALEVMAAFPEISHWVVGGHSLGGAMAANFAGSHPDRVDGLVLWAAYPAQADDLSAQDLLVSSIYGSADGLATQEEIDGSRPLLPPQTSWVAIEGGNHAQFGSYGPQAGDNPAAISAEEQQEQIVAATVSLLNEVSGS